MAYVVVVFAIINTLVLVAAMLGFLMLRDDLVTSVGTVIEDEVRRQDDRIEKRLAKREGSPGEDLGDLTAATDGRMIAGRPHRR